MATDADEQVHGKVREWLTWDQVGQDFSRSFHGYKFAQIINNVQEIHIHLYL